MALPPKSDDDTPSIKKPRAKSPRTPKAKAASEDKPAKPAKRVRSKSAAAKAEQTEFPGVSESRPTPPPPPAPEPQVREVREEAPPAREREPERIFEPTRPPERERPPEPQARDERPEPRQEASEAPSAAADARAEERGDRGGEERPAQTPQEQGGDRAPGGEQPQQTRGDQQHPHQRHQHDDRGGRGEWKGGGGGGHSQHQQGGGQHGGGGNDRFSWKHGKRKRGRGGNWEQGGGGQHGGHGQHGGQHGGGRERPPAQQPPPSVVTPTGDIPREARFADLAALDALATELAAGTGEAIWLNQVYAKTLAELTSFARELGVPFEGVPNKRQLLTEIFKFAAAQKRTVRDLGYIDQNDRGYFLVHEHVNYRLYPEDAYLPESLVKRYGLKRGHRVEAVIQPPQEGERCPSVVRIESVMGLSPDAISKVTPFEELVPYYPLKRILLEDADVVKDVSMRAVDILTPIGFGQRGLIVAPPRTGKTVLLQNIANSISANSPEVKLILLLIDERPEEVTDFRRHTKGEVVSSTFDETPESHVHCAEMVIEMARRRIEQGEHVVILLDSITRLARAYNALTTGGKTMSGGLESNALQKPKRFFGSARNIEGGGSLTIIGTALIDTGSRMDEIIFEEFKGTGNSELHLDRGLVERRIFPAINIDRSGTRKEELLYHPDELQRIFSLRRAMQGLGPIESMEMLITRLKKTKSNTEFLLSLAPK